MKTSLGLAAIATLLFTADAGADVSKNVEKAFRGDILLTDTPLPPSGETDAQTINAYKTARAKSLESSEVEGVAEWAFLYTAFLKKPPKVTSLSLDFYTADRDRRYVANKRFVGIDPKATILSGQVSINEDDGLAKGRTYVVKLVGTVKRKEVVFAQTKITMK